MDSSITIHQYADDLMLYTALVPALYDDLTFIVKCAEAVSAWFTENALLLNPGKSEAVIFGTRQRLGRLGSSLSSSRGIDVAGVSVSFNDSLKLLGVTLDETIVRQAHHECRQELYVPYSGAVPYQAVPYRRGS